MKLHILRHGKAQVNSTTGKDIDRSLRPKGVKQCAQLNHDSLNLPDTLDVWCSQAARTRETCALMSLQQGQAVDYRLGLYLCSRNQLLQDIWNRSGNEDLLIIGHNFGISELAEYFLEQEIELRTAEFISIDFGESTWEEVSKGLGTISHRFRPSLS